MRRRPLRIGNKQTEIVFGEGLVDRLDSFLPHGGNAPVVLITDENVLRCQGARLPHGIDTLVLPPGEPSKSIATLQLLIDTLLEKGMDRSGTVVAFGGGVVSDIAGFAAATFMRGVRWVVVPTTLLAMVDASIGGKTAVNTDRAKNVAGAFHAPDMVVADPTTLQTLPEAERTSGMAEVIKHAVISSGGLFERLESGLFGSADDLFEAMEVKAAIVERDPFERGERAVLNLGHTVGHGIEAASRYALSHGQAVAIGMVAEAEIAESIGIAAAGTAGRIREVGARFKLPSTAALDADAVRSAMRSDKKRASGKLRFSLPKDIGDVVYGVEVEERVVGDALLHVCAD